MSTAEQLADLIDDDGIEHLTVSRSEIAAELRRLAAENAALQAEILEQCRIIGISGSQEARLLAENEKLQATIDDLVKDNARLREALTQPAQQPLTDERAEFEAWAEPITALAQENGKYAEVMTSLAWAAWQARAQKGKP